jgi:hypothetical protein
VKKLASNSIQNNSYGIDVTKWICGCPYYLTNRFMICKHLIHFNGNIDTNFFHLVKRNHTYLFLIILNENEHLVTTEHLAQNKTIIMHTINNKDDVEINKEPSFDEFIQIIEFTSKILKEQKDAGNIEWLKKVKKNFKPLKKMIKDIENYNKRHIMPLT